jgi:predicted nucleic acid-binding protein
MSDKTFVDTNVLIYAHDVQAGIKHEVAAGLLKQLWDDRTGLLSTQVLQEFYVNVTRKVKPPLARPSAREVVRLYSAWPVQQVGTDEILRASEIEARHRISFWDALIVASASSAGASRILSEDLGTGQRIAGLLVENPFARR